jgi:hypothetical protein
MAAVLTGARIGERIAFNYGRQPWAHAIDVYVSPFETVQHKVDWLANKPGIIHTNQSLLETHHYWATIEYAPVPRYARRSSVSGIRSAQKDAPIYERVSDYNEVGSGVQRRTRKCMVIRSLTTTQWNGNLCSMIFWTSFDHANRLSFSKSALTYIVKWKLKNTLRSLSSVLDTSKI